MSSYSEGQIHQLADALEAIGFSGENLTQLGQNKKGILTGTLSVLRGRSEIVPIPPTTESRGGYNFTERFRRVLSLAREEAGRLRHEYVGTEHLLLGLLGLLVEGEGVAALVLQNLNIDPDDIWQKIENTVKRGKASVKTGPDLPYTSRAKKVIELAMMEARNFNHTHVGTEHLLLGIIHEKKGIAAQVLSDLGVSLESTRKETLLVLGRAPSSSTVAPLDPDKATPEAE